MSSGAAKIRAAGSGCAGALHRIAVRCIGSPARGAAPRKYSLCIVKPDGLGDFVLATGAIRLLVNHFGPEACALVIVPVVRELADMEFPDTPKLIVPPFRFSLRPDLIWAAMQPRRLLGTFQFDRMVCLRHQRLRFQNLVLHWIAAERRHGLISQAGGHLGKDFEFAFDHAVAYPERADEGRCLELEAHRRVAEEVLHRNVFGHEIVPNLRSLQRDSGNYMLVCPFANTPIRSYPMGLLEVAVTEIQRRFATPVMLSCSTENYELGKTLEARLRRRGAFILPLQRTSLQDYLKAVACARAVLTVDTATAHVATALDLPTVVILGGGHYGQFGPWRRSAKQEWLTHAVPCFHCGWNCTEPEAYCITRVTPASIAEAMSRVLGME